RADILLLDVDSGPIADMLALSRMLSVGGARVLAVDCLGQSRMHPAELMHAGVVGFVPLARDPKLLVSALQAVERGEMAFYLDRLGEVARSRVEAAEVVLDSLNQRILELLASGLVDREIG